jgi:hypothetical protein
VASSLIFANATLRMLNPISEGLGFVVFVFFCEHFSFLASHYLSFLVFAENASLVFFFWRTRAWTTQFFYLLAVRGPEQ